VILQAMHLAPFFFLCN